MAPISERRRYLRLVSAHKNLRKPNKLTLDEFVFFALRGPPGEAIARRASNQSVTAGFNGGNDAEAE